MTLTAGEGSKFVNDSMRRGADVSSAATSRADEIRAMARAVSPDPFTFGAADALPVVWIYGRGQFELARLRRIVVDGFAANRFVHYIDNYGHPEHVASYAVGPLSKGLRISWPKSAGVHVNGVPARLGNDGWYGLPASPDTTIIHVDADDDVPVVCVEADSFEPGLWSVLHEGAWVLGQGRPGRPEHPAHAEDEPLETLRLTPQGSPGLFDAGATVLGRPVFAAGARPTISTGESLEEARYDGIHETRHDVVQRADGLWTSVHRLGFRYLRVQDAEVGSVVVEANIRARVVPEGAFACSDDHLTRMAAIAAYTIRLCMQGLVLDGVKRDRMPWIGDQALNSLANAYTVADGRIVSDGLVALGRPRHGYVNGIADYSLWWIINQGFFQRYFGDRSHLVREADIIDWFVSRIADDCGADGVFRPRPEGSFSEAPGAVLIDWGVNAEPGRDLTALQILWFWALETAADLLEKVGHEGAERWRAHASTLETTLFERAWDAGQGAWREYLDSSGTGTPYPNVIAILAGLGEVTDEMVRTIQESRLGTPFMTGFALKALASAGRTDLALRRMRNLWGPMMTAEATTFWEEFTHPGESPFAMYGRPFGKSLSHAWGAGPASLLPEIILGIRPTSDGWNTFVVRPKLGELSWASTVVATPYGEITVDAQRDRATVSFPAGTSLHGPDGLIHGPATTSFALD